MPNSADCCVWVAIGIESHCGQLCVYRESHCNIQPWARAAHLYHSAYVDSAFEPQWDDKMSISYAFEQTNNKRDGWRRSLAIDDVSSYVWNRGPSLSVERYLALFCIYQTSWVKNWTLLLLLLLFSITNVAGMVQLERAITGDKDAARTHLALPRDGTLSLWARQLWTCPWAWRAVLPGGDVGTWQSLAS